MSTDPSAAALGPDDAVADALASPAATESRSDLADLAAAIERLEALMATGPGLDGSAAVERIADIAFVLHEREVEASLCDALDAAVREISDSGLLKSAGTQRTQEAAELLRDLSRRVNDLMARKQAEQAADLSEAAQPSRRAATVARFDDEDMAADEAIAADLFATDLPEDDEFARVVAGLAGSLPVRADEELASDPPPEAAAVSAQSFDPRQSADPAARGSDDASLVQSDRVLVSVAAVEMTLVVESRDAVISGDVLGDVSGDFAREASAPADVASGEPPSEQSSGDVTSAEEFVGEQAPSDLPLESLSSVLAEAAAPESVSNEAATQTASREAILNEASPGEAALPGHLPGAELAVDSTAAALSEDPASVSALALPVPDVITPADVIAPTSVEENHSPTVIAPASPAAMVAGEDSAEPHSDREPAHHDDQSVAEMFTPGEPDQPRPVEAVNSPAAIAVNVDEIFAPVEPKFVEPKPIEPKSVEPEPVETKSVEPEPVETKSVEPEPVETKSVETKPAEPTLSRTVLPVVSIDPDEDPFDLFEPTTSAAPSPVSGGAARPVAAAPAPTNVAAKVEKAPQPASDSEQKPVASAQAATSATGMPLSATPPTAKPDAKPQAQPAPPRGAPAVPPPAPRPAPTDPLAPVRALSEDEMIALFS